MKQLELKLNTKLFTLFKKIISLDYAFEKKDRIFIIKAENVFFEKVLDELSDYLIKEGLTKDNDANVLGMEVETLIDYVSNVYYGNN